jgi:hypothetical protein
LLCSAQVPEQTTVSGNIISPRGNFSFNFPSGTYTQYDTLTTLFYASNVDTLLTLQTHFVGNVTINSTDSIWTTLLNQNSNDTLRAMGAFMLVMSNGQLSSIQNINPTINNPKGVELSFICAGEADENNLVFTRLYLKNGQFYAFTAASVQSDIIRLGTYKTTFFNSINFLSQ